MSARGRGRRTRIKPRAKRRDARDYVRLWLRLLGCANLVENNVRARLRAQFGSTLPRFDMLAQLDAAERDSKQGLTMTELSRRLMVSNGNVTGLAGRLVGERLVSRTVSSRDRRSQSLRLTSAGRRALEEIANAHRDWIAEMFKGITPEQSTQLFELLARLRNSVQEATR